MTKETAEKHEIRRAFQNLNKSRTKGWRMLLQDATSLFARATIKVPSRRLCDHKQNSLQIEDSKHLLSLCSYKVQIKTTRLIQC